MTLADHHADSTRHPEDLVVTPLSEEPKRARALGSLYWEAHVPGEAEPPLRCTVGEDWIVRRVAGGSLRFASWRNTMHHFLPDSSVDRLTLVAVGAGGTPDGRG